jgi:DNA-binding transcriptional regulator LsrR (DeoR family)
VAQLYHVQGLYQDQIGRQLGVSRSKVSRTLLQLRPDLIDTATTTRDHQGAACR